MRIRSRLGRSDLLQSTLSLPQLVLVFGLWH